jgi:hypothetical protein
MRKSDPDAQIPAGSNDFQCGAQHRWGDMRQRPVYFSPFAVEVPGSICPGEGFFVMDILFPQGAMSLTVATLP